MTRISLPKTAHQLLKNRLKPGDIAIDATTGNGHDTLFLAQEVAPQGHIFGFDIQLQALEATAQRLTDAGLEQIATLFHASHANMANLIPIAHHGHIQAIMFNLGYLPGSNKSVITQTKSTVAALTAACQLLAPAGLMTILAYPGHSGGDKETAQVQQWLEGLERTRFDFETLYSHVDKTAAPRLFHIEKKQ